MSRLLRLEELALFLFAGVLFSTLPYAWWLFAALLLAPDLAMAGYAFGPAAGAIAYNVVHHRALALGLYAAGALAATPWISLIGVVLAGPHQPRSRPGLRSEASRLVRPHTPGLDRARGARPLTARRLGRLRSHGAPISPGRAGDVV